MRNQPQRSKVRNLGGLLYFTFAVVFISLGFVFHISIQQKCYQIQKDISFLNKKEKSHLNQIKYLTSEVKMLTSPERIERIARERFGMISPKI